MSDQRCGTCRHFRPAKGPTGRVRPSEPGTCGWMHPCAADPIAFPGHAGFGADLVTVGSATAPRGVAWADTSGRACKCWEAK